MKKGARGRAGGGVKNWRFSPFSQWGAGGHLGFEAYRYNTHITRAWGCPLPPP
jgi:hypothetical protein